MLTTGLWWEVAWVQSEDRALAAIAAGFLACETALKMLTSWLRARSWQAAQKEIVVVSVCWAEAALEYFRGGWAFFCFNYCPHKGGVLFK